MRHSWRHLSLRAFDDKTKRKQYEKQGGICVRCEEHFEYEEMVGDRKLAWGKGGHTVPENCQMLCRLCNAIKSDK